MASPARDAEGQAEDATRDPSPVAFMEEATPWMGYEEMADLMSSFIADRGLSPEFRKYLETK